jgi:hypothetical protein
MKPTDEELEQSASLLSKAAIGLPVPRHEFHRAAALLRACKGRVKVKPLEWRDRVQKDRPIRFITESKCGRYQITEWLDGSGNVLCFSTPFGKPERLNSAPHSAGGPEPLKAAAQADHEARTLAATEQEIGHE